MIHVIVSNLLWSGIHGLNEELGMHRGKEGKSEYVFCSAECEGVVHVFSECSACSNIRGIFVEKLQLMWCSVV